MDTKWKNMVKAIKKFIKEYYDCVFGALMFIIGSFLFFVMLVNRYYFSTWGVWRICLIGNILVQPGICLLVRRYMKLRYRNWSQKGSAETYLQDTEDSIYYQTWKAKEKQSEKRFRNILAVELSAAAAYLFFISYSSGWGWNYAAGYMMVATVFIEYICCREVIQRYWRNELDQIMEQTESFFQKRLEQALEIERKSLEKVSRSDQLRVDLITNVSHDLKTPLTSIVGYLELIKKEELSDVVRDYVDVISTRAGKLGEMINSLFSLAKASSGNVELHKETFELNRLMEQIFADMDDRIKERLPGMKDYFWEDREYMIIPAGTCKELMDEGRTLHHCVGSSDTYMRKMADGVSWILFLRKKSELKKPYYTIEISLKDDHIIQFYSEYDRQPDKETINDVLNRYKWNIRKKKIKIQVPAAGIA